MSELALKLGSIVATLLVMAGGFGYATTHLKNPNAPLQPPVEKSADDPWGALARAREILLARIRALTPDERRAVVQRGKDRRTARRMLRRTLEHEWEHRREIAVRLGREA